MLELTRFRSAYLFKEADALTWVVAKLPVSAQAALMALLFDEYGAGDPYGLRARRFAHGMRACGLDASYGAYVDDASWEVPTAPSCARSRAWRARPGAARVLARWESSRAA